MLSAIREAGRRQGRPGLVAAAAIVMFAVVGIGGPLVGRGAFSASEQLIYRTPWAQELQTPATDGQSPLNDTYEQYQPSIHEWAARLRDGDLPLTSPYEHGGTALAAWTADGTLDPLNLPWLVLPADLAPGYVKLLEIAVAAGFMYLFCRRLGTGRAPAWIGGMAYAASGFQIAWTNWPQTHVGAATAPLFWALERLIQGRRWRDVSLLAAMVAWHLAAGFPSVTLMTLLVAGVYTIFRLVELDRTPGRRVLRGGAMAAAAVVLGAGVVAIQLAGLNHVLSSSDLSNREYFLGAHADRAELATALLPGGLGLPEWGGWVRPGNIIEAQTFVGGAVMLLAAGVIVRRRAPRAAGDVLDGDEHSGSNEHPGSGEVAGSAAFFVLLTVFSIVIVFVGGPVLEALQRVVPPLAENYIGRWRSVMGFGVAVLAALGANRWADIAARRLGPRRWWWYGAAAVLATASAAFVVAAVTPVPPQNLPSVRVGVAVLVCSLTATAVVIWCTGRRRRWGIFLAAPIIAIEALSFVLPYWHRTPDELFFPPSPLVSAAGAAQGHDRVEGVAAVGRGVTSWYRLRTATGYSPAPVEWADLMQRINPTLPRTSWATELMTVDQATQGSAVLDRLGVRYLIVGAPAIVSPLPADWTPLLTSAGGTLVERSTSLSRFRWASTSVVIGEPSARIDAIAAGLDPSVMIVERPSGAAEGGTGSIAHIDETDSDRRRIEITANGPGYLVVADAYDSRWQVTVDGRAAELLRADHAMMAVAVPAGDHVVELSYSLPSAPLAASTLSVVLLIAMAAADVIIVGRRRRAESCIVLDGS